MNVSLKDFLKTGVFGAIEFGMTSDQILEMLGSPDTIFTRRKNPRPTCFEYGDVEFYFFSSKDNRLSSIYLDHFDIPKGSQLLNLDAWILRGTLSQSEVESVLTEAGISFQPKEMSDSSMDGIITEGGVVLGFIRESEEYSPPSGLYNISLSVQENTETDANERDA
ncbi:MAG TPA: hypothetical protein VGD05_05385 [Pyrinomonadaceae bacterium]